jgi:hypothetical protein
MKSVTSLRNIRKACSFQPISGAGLPTCADTLLKYKCKKINEVNALKVLQFIRLLNIIAFFFVPVSPAKLVAF